MQKPIKFQKVMKKFLKIEYFITILKKVCSSVAIFISLEI